jgi:hypothetical protein
LLPRFGGSFNRCGVNYIIALERPG